MESAQPNPLSVIVDVKDGSDDAGGEEEHAGDGGGARRCSAERSDCGEEEAEIVKERMRSFDSECSVEVDPAEIKVYASKSERDCRICQMNLDAANQESGVPIELGCSCKDDLAAAHRQCAETWFKIKGNTICEVCGSMALNVSGPSEVESVEHWNEANGTAQQASALAAPTHVAEPRNFWQGHRFLNFLLACMVFAFVISWLFHFNVPP